MAGRVAPSPELLSPDSLLQRGMVALRHGDLAHAAGCLRDLCNLAPDHSDGWHFLGVSALRGGDLKEAQRCIERSLLLCNTKAAYFTNYGLLLAKFGRRANALKMFTRATVMSPDHADAWEQLGALELELHGPTERAEEALRRALELDPSRPDSLYHMAEIFLSRKRYEPALSRLQRLHAMRPDDLQVLEKLTAVCEKLNELEEAITYAQHAEIIAPGNPAVEHDLGRFHGGLGNLAQARYHFQRAAELPGGKREWRWRHLSHCPQVFESEEGITQYWDTLESDLDEAIAEAPVYDWRTLPQRGFSSPFHLPHLDRCCRGVKEKFTALFARSFEQAGFQRPERDEAREKIRVGFLVTPGHEGGFLRLTRGLIENLDATRFEPVLICHESSRKRLSKHFRRADLKRIAFPSDFPAAAEKIRAAKCDLIYYWKIGADVWSFYLPMARLAAIQCTSWGTHGTSGSEFVDYYVSWDRAEPPNAPLQYTEELHLFGCNPVYEPRLALQTQPTRSQLKLPEGGAIYFCPHRVAKYHPVFDSYLGEILTRDPAGHAVLLTGKDRHLACQLKARIRRNVGPAAASRIIFLPQQSVDSYYRYLSAATVVLNSAVYAGEITSVDSFLYGVPSVALTGHLLIQRYTTAYYEYMGIDGFAQSDREGYVELAVRLGTDLAYRKHVSDLIRDRSKRIFDSQDPVREWESFIEKAVSARATGG